MALPPASTPVFDEGHSLVSEQTHLSLESKVVFLTLDLKWEGSVGGVSLCTTSWFKQPYMVGSRSSVTWLSSARQLSPGPSCACSQMMNGTGIYLEARLGGVPGWAYSLTSGTQRDGGSSHRCLALFSRTASLRASLGFLATWHQAWISPEQGFRERKAEIRTPAPDVMQQSFGLILFDATPAKIQSEGAFRRARRWGCLFNWSVVPVSMFWVVTPGLCWVPSSLW